MSEYTVTLTETDVETLNRALAHYRRVLDRAMKRTDSEVDGVTTKIMDLEDLVTKISDSTGAAAQ